MVQQTTNGLRYPESADELRINESIQELAEDIDPHLNSLTLQYYTADDTWNKPSGLKFVIVECVGGGGAGGGSPSCASNEVSAGSGGTGGWYCSSVILASALSTTETVTVGTGGSGVSGANGNNGADTSFGSHVVAPGGIGGTAYAAATSNNYLAGTFSTGGTQVGDVTANGGAGGSAVRLSNYNTCQGGYGGDTRYGGGGRPNINGATGLGGIGFGSGGSGSSTRHSGPSRSGGGGADGVVIVWEYY